MKRGFTKPTESRIANRWLLTICILLNSLWTANAQQYTPFHYFTFDGANPLKDSVSSLLLNTSYYQGTYTTPASPVGKSFGLNPASSDVIVTPSLVLDSAITLEFLFKPSHEYGNTNTFFTRRDGSIYIKMGFPYIVFITNATSSAGGGIHHEQYVELNGVGRGSYSYYVDGNYHHFVFKYNPKTGAKEIWIDGQLPSGFSATTATGKFNSNSSNTSQNIVDLNSVTSYDKINGNLDEIALYNFDLPGSMIYKHYTEFQQGKHYTFNATTLTPPSPSPIVAGIDLNDFAPGHPTPTVNAVDQLKNFPTARFKKGHTLLPNFNWIGMEYFGSAYQPGVSNAQALNNTIAIQTELAKNFNYSILVASNTNTYSEYTNPNYFQGAWVQLANQNPQWKTAAISFWAQMNPQVAGFASNYGYISNKNLPPQHYLRNSAGTFLDLNGNPNGGKYWSPSAPVDSFYKDGLTQKFLMQKLLNSLTRPLNFLCENGEVIPKPELNAMQNDPLVVSDKATTNYDWDTYLGSRKLRVSKAYRDQFISLPGLQNTIYTEYQISGAKSRIKYSETRNINKTINGTIYATPDFYPRWAGNWYTGVSAWNGWMHIAEGRYYELQMGDKLYSPFVAAGWDVNEEANIRPGQWLGLLKLLGMTGAEFYYTGYFNEAGSYNAPNPPPANPGNYAWQAVMPSYAQATTSRYEDILRNGSLMPGDVVFNINNPNQPGYSFITGDNRKMVVIRKHDQKNLYAVTGTIQPNSNMMGNAEIEGDVAVNLNGQNLQFKIRRQGSTYIYDNTNPSQPVFYQIDSWHEASHPYRWSKDFNFEAEVFENSAPLAQIKTDRDKNAVAGDFRNSTSYVSQTSTATTYPTLEYNFTPRSTSNYYFWIRARSKNAVAGGLNISLNGQNQKSIGCITDTTWKWYSVDACSNQAIRFTSLGTQEYLLAITPNSTSIEIDRILLTIDPALNLNPNQAACNSAIATVTTSGPTSFCQGGSVTLTAATGSSYLWSSGQTTQSIVVNAAGNYSVTINNGTGCSSVSVPVSVSISNNIAPTISSNGATSICSGQSVSLTASAGTAYLWSNGATTQSINVTTSGSYLVSVTNAGGCSATSSAKTVAVSTIPVATITPAGNTKFCQGGSVVLSAPSGLNYAWSNGKSTQQITVTSNGSYAVTVTNSNGCSSTSQALAIVTTPLPTAAVVANGPTNFCNGGSVVLNASGGTNYLWSNGATTANLSVSTSGSYLVTVTDGNGCTALSNSTIVNQYPAATASITITGPSALTSGQTTTLSASTGNSYLWQPGGMTTASIQVSTPGSYSVTVTNSNNCSATSAPFNITQNTPGPNLSIQSSGPLSFCEGGSVKLTANGGTRYLWSPGGATTASITTNTSGVYYLYSIDNNGLVIGTDSTKVTVNPNPMVPCISISYIPNTAYQLLATEPSAVTYNWSNGQTTASVNVTQQQALTVRVTNAFGCQSGSQSMAVNSVVARACIMPDMLTAYNISDTSSIVGWNPSITGEQFVVRYWEKGSSVISENTLHGNVSTFLISTLIPGTYYEWTVEMVCGASRFLSTTGSFQTLSKPLSCGSIPQHLRAVNLNIKRAELKWYTTTADSYQLKYRPVGTTAWNKQQLIGSQYNKGTALNNLVPNTTYEWQIQTTCNGYTTPFSASSMFKTLDTCGYLGNLNVASVGINSVNLQWSNTNYMTNIRIKITDTRNGFYRIVSIYYNPVNGIYTALNLKPGVTYKASVRGMCNSASLGAWSNEVLFTTNDLYNRIDNGNPLQLNGFPNPVSDRLSYSFITDESSDYTLKVCDLSGRELMQEIRTADSGQNAGDIPVNNYSKGIYLLVLQKGTQTSRFRFSVQ